MQFRMGVDHKNRIEQIDVNIPGAENRGTQTKTKGEDKGNALNRKSLHEKIQQAEGNGIYMETTLPMGPAEDEIKILYPR